ncbi:hypothetical protein A3H38_04375 [candidate division WOR-1 bacterium RIFCSPLOWO2_02_FULL_46_20]|uniref:DUF5723 domain-containing protein n=1 Tax=candidate division WOR-1 bacterium RIFCSPLOWO2_02_FULL_46_20 TaxID=1802567 RepID=A0A1F4R3S7_UNCSA|nr:MAG: hypothetical protein A3H38_04375 [candidate division WOR-1 bacterium RIFCSPLOWO2_02_FULL_46_20]
MCLLKRLVVIIIAVFSLTIVVHADFDFPYGSVKIKVPPSENPFPGFGSYYSTIAKGMKSILWNPASLGKLGLTEASFATISPSDTYGYSRTMALSETSGTLEGGASLALLFRPPAEIGSGISTTDINVTVHADYATSSTGINFSSALKVNDQVAIGFTSNNPLELDLNLAGSFPITVRTAIDLKGQTVGGMEIANDGKLKYTFGSGATITTYESTQPIWDGFLTQEVTVPFTNLSELRNNISIQSPYTGTLAGNFGQLCLGINMVPIYATANIQNDVRTVVNSDTDDGFLYTPNFDTSNQTELASWINDSDNYGSAAGYQRKVIKLPARETIATAKYKGDYTASTARFDIGAIFDVNNWLTVGLNLENASGSSLNFKGTGRSAYVTYREINTEDAGDVAELIQPGGKSAFDLFTDTWVSTTEAGGNSLFLEAEKNYALPKKIRFGIAFKKPFLIAVDFEQNQVPIKYMTTENNLPVEITISKINFMKIGTEMRIFALPVWLRGGTTLMSKPEISSLSAGAQSSLDKVFQYGFLPLNFDLGLETNAWDVIINTAFGINAQSLISSMQLDTGNMGLNKLVYYDITLGKDAWQISYLAEVDPTGTASAYGTKTVPAGTSKSFAAADIKFVQTLGLTYRF